MMLQEIHDLIKPWTQNKQIHTGLERLVAQSLQAVHNVNDVVRFPYVIHVPWNDESNLSK